MAFFDAFSARTLIKTLSPSDFDKRIAEGDANAIAGLGAVKPDNPLILDGRRTRPRYFDGRFLTAADLTRDQDYVRQRQADLARASGTGVIAGLRVSLPRDGQSLIMEPGHGVTPGGEIVAISTRRLVPIADLPATRRLDARFGLRLEASQPIANRSGLFILALRPVEFTANRIAAYPTSLAGARGMQDGDIIEASAVTLIPYPDIGGVTGFADMRRAAARAIFLEGSASGEPQDALALAMLALDRGVIRWLDVDMVRRETGADTPLQVTMGGRPRALSEAHVLQYARHLADATADAGGGFAASQVFGALPAAGPMPLNAVTRDAFGFLQSYFPAFIDTEVSLIADDELGALVEESLALPPIDLSGDSAALNGAGVVILAPVPRKLLRGFADTLGSGGLSQAVRGSDLGAGAAPTPFTLLQDMLRRRPPVPLPPAPPPAAAPPWDSVWADARNAMAANAGATLWYARRRAVPANPRLAGVAAPVAPP